jgi:hypothetical protein
MLTMSCLFVIVIYAKLCSAMLVPVEIIAMGIVRVLAVALLMSAISGLPSLRALQSPIRSISCR